MVFIRQTYNLTLMNKQAIVAQVFKRLGLLDTATPKRSKGSAFAPSNIALVKYWGKSIPELNIPMTDSLSVSLGDLGAHTQIQVLNHALVNHEVLLNGQQLVNTSEFYIRIAAFLDLFKDILGIPVVFKVETQTNIPVAAGLASSACGFAALVLALDNLYGWNLNESDLSILARLGSGSAARSMWQGFVYWQRGEQTSGLDCYAYKLSDVWADFSIGLLLISQEKKPISSREAMLQTVNTSILYKAWPQQVARDIEIVAAAIKAKDLKTLGETVENNALAMHATMLSAKPAICYSTPQTIQAMHKIWQLRKDGVEVYFTQDAGPNLKLLFDKKYQADVISSFPELIMVNNHMKNGVSTTES